MGFALLRVKDKIWLFVVNNFDLFMIHHVLVIVQIDILIYPKNIGVAQNYPNLLFVLIDLAILL